MLRIFAALLFCVLLAGAASAQKRVALVIGIDRYDNLDGRAQLKKARADARGVAETLKSLGFDVIHKDDVARSAFNSHWQDFLNKLSAGDTAAFYFAGHGIELGGRNYLIPRDVPSVRPGRDELLKRESLSLQEFLADLRERGTRLNLVILDACRDNPFEQVAGRSVGTARGLAVTEPPEGTFIMYSAGTGESALDSLNDADPNPNSVYTRMLLPLLKAKGHQPHGGRRASSSPSAANNLYRPAPADTRLLQPSRRTCVPGGRRLHQERGTSRRTGSGRDQARPIHRRNGARTLWRRTFPGAGRLGQEASAAPARFRDRGARSGGACQLAQVHWDLAR
jgi:hypothetical protein